MWRFAWVGAIGFLVDATLLTQLVKGYGWDNYSARLISFGCAVSVTYYLNRRWTFFERATTDRKTEYKRYFVVQTIGALLNLGIYAGCVAVNQTLAHYPVVPLAIGAAVSMVFSFVASRRFVFTRREGAAPDAGDSAALQGPSNALSRRWSESVGDDQEPLV